MKPSDRPSQRPSLLKSLSIFLFLGCALTPTLLAELALLPAATAHTTPSLNPPPSTLYPLPSTPHPLPSTPQRLHIAQASPRLQEAMRLNQEGNQFLAQEQYQQALENYQQALKILQELGNRQGEAVLLLNVGSAYGGLQKNQEALRTYQQAAIVAREVGDRSVEATALRNSGYIYNRLRQPQRALEAFQRAQQLFQVLGNRQEEGVMLLNVGNAYESLNQYPEAIRSFQQAAIVLQEVGDRSTAATAISNIGVAYSYLGQPQQALDAFDRALAIRRELGDRAGEAIVINNMADVYRDLGKFQQALELSQRSIAIHRELGDRDGEMTALNNLAATHNSLGQSDKALRIYQQALAISRELKNQSAEATLLNNLGRSYDRLKQPDQALDYYQQSLVLLQAMGDRQRQSITLSNIAGIYSRQRQTKKAIEGYQQALAIAQALGDRASQATFLNNIGALYGETGDRKRALDYYIQSLPLLRTVGKQVEEGTTLSNIGLVYFELKDYSNAEKYLLETVQVWESLRPGLTDENKVSLFETQSYSYRLLQESLIAQKKVEKALEVSERGRSRAFVELLATRLQGAAAIQRLKPITIAEMKQVAKDQKATLVEYSIVNDRVIYIWVVKPTGELAFQQVELKDLPRDEGKSPLRSLVDNSRSNDLSVRGRGISFVEDTTVLRQATSQIQATSENDRPHLQKLHELLIQPIAQQLPKDPNDRIIFMPQGELFFVPFPALQDSSGKYLIEKHTILTSPAIQVLQLTRQQRLRQVSGVRCQISGAQMSGARMPTTNPDTCTLKPDTLLIVGNPTMPSIGNPPQQLSSLPGSESEAKAIAQLLGAQPVIGAEATKANVIKKMQTARLIHLATHGLLDDYKGLGVPGAIALAPDLSPSNSTPSTPNPPLSTPAGLLTASEILDLKLNADLVVLSACDTGRGKITGDGVIGLSRSLLTAGATSVVVSLWKVPDDSTSFMMQQFYQNLKQPGTDKATALRKAMVTTLQQFSEPQEWAAFTIIGEAE